MSEDLPSLRSEIAEVDREILTLVQRRMALAEKIGLYKHTQNLPVRDFRTEVDVLARARDTAGRLGLDEDLATTLVQALIEGAVRTQHVRHARLRSGTPQTAMEPKKILVVGGAGRMGAWLVEFFEDQGHTVSVFDTTRDPVPVQRFPSLAEAVPGQDVIVLSVPLGRSAAVLDEVLSYRPAGLVFDICSLKTPLLEPLESAAKDGVRIASVHPMFAPGARLLSGRVLLVCDCGHAQAAQQVRRLFEETALRIVELNVRDHDRLMGVVLGLSHAVNIAFARALCHIGIPYSSLDEVASTTFGRQIRTTAEVATENPQLYYEIQHLNAHTGEVLEALDRALHEVRAAALSDTADDFLTLMSQGREFFGR